VILILFVISPSFIQRSVGAQPALLLLVALLCVAAVSLAWADVRSQGSLVGLGLAGAWAVVAAIAAVFLAILAAFLAGADYRGI
jgi:hypothetical protein